MKILENLDLQGEQLKPEHTQQALTFVQNNKGDPARNSNKLFILPLRPEDKEVCAYINVLFSINLHFY